MSDQDIIIRLERLERMIKTLVQEKKAKAWVKSYEILRLTGRNREWLRQRRVDGTIDWKKTERGFFYDANSIPSIFIRHENERSHTGDAGMDVPLSRQTLKS